jgi:predicted amidophosphoribosyltransferase
MLNENQNNSGENNRNNSEDFSRGRGRMKGFSLGPGGYCVCPSCGKKVPHQRGTPCYQQKCPDCGQPMVRER